MTKKRSFGVVITESVSSALISLGIVGVFLIYIGRLGYSPEQFIIDYFVGIVLLVAFLSAIMHEKIRNSGWVK